MASTAAGSASSRSRRRSPPDANSSAARPCAFLRRMQAGQMGSEVSSEAALTRTRRVASLTECRSKRGGRHPSSHKGRSALERGPGFIKGFGLYSATFRANCGYDRKVESEQLRLKIHGNPRNGNWLQTGAQGPSSIGHRELH